MSLDPHKMEPLIGGVAFRIPLRFLHRKIVFGKLGVSVYTCIYARVCIHMYFSMCTYMMYACLSE